MKIFRSSIQRHQENLGFTLVELLLYMALLGILITAMAAMFLSVIETGGAAQNTSIIEQDAQFLIARLGYDLKRAESVILPVTAGQTTSSLQLQIDGQVYSYSTTNNQLEYNTPSGTSQLTAPDTRVNAISFQKVGYPDEIETVQIIFTLEDGAAQQTRTTQTSIGLR